VEKLLIRRRSPVGINRRRSFFSSRSARRHRFGAAIILIHSASIARFLPRLFNRSEKTKAALAVTVMVRAQGLSL